MIKKNTIHLVLSYFIVIGFLGTVILKCNSIPNSVNQINSSFTPEIKDKFDREDTLFLFQINPGHIVDFSGSRSYIYTKNGTRKEHVLAEPIYCRITSLGDTVPIINDSIYGQAQFIEKDIHNTGWATMYSCLKDTSSLVGEILSNMLSKENLEMILSIDSAKNLLDTHKVAMLCGLNNCLNEPNIYQTYHNKIKEELKYFVELLDTLKTEVNRMMDRSIMTDTLGTINEILSPFQQETLKWFNRRLFTKFFTLLALSPDGSSVFNKFSQNGRIYSFLFQQGTSALDLPNRETRRLFEVKNTNDNDIRMGLSQIAEINDAGVFLPKNSDVAKIHRYPFETIDDWKVAPIFWQPDIPFLSLKEFSTLTTTGYATFELVKYSADLDTMQYEMKCYYSIKGTITKNQKPLKVNGTIALNIGFYNFSYPYTFEHAYFYHWHTNTSIYALDDNLDIVEQYVEKCELFSNDKPQF